MKAAIIYGKENISIEEIEQPKVDDVDNVLIKVLYCGICGSDLPKYFGHAVKKYPLILGHEISGIVEKGPENLKGKLVTVKPKFFCGECDNCKSKQYNLCTNSKSMGSSFNGGFQQYITVPEKYVMVIDNLKDNPKLGALIEPFSIGIHALKLLDADIKEVAIIGNGTMSNMVRMALKYTYPQINNIDIIFRSFPIETKLGAYDIVFECSGKASGFNSAIKICKCKGTIIQIGILYPENIDTNLTLDTILRKELTIKGSWDSDFHKNWEDAYKIITDNQKEFEKLITSIYDLDDIDKAFNHKHSNDIHTDIKVLVNVADEKWMTKEKK